MTLFINAQAGIVPSNSEQTSRLRITNQCDKTLWIQQDYKNKTNDPIAVKIPQGSSYDYTIPDIGLASTRFWPKSGCNEFGYNCTVGESTGVPEAEKQGHQQGPYAPDINSKFEATWGCLKSIFDNNPSLCAVNPSDPSHHLNSETWWNGSAVDGYTFPYSIKVKNHNSSCMDIVTGKALANPGVSCANLSPTSCPSDANLSTEGKFNVVNGINITKVNLQWVDVKTGTPIGCFSPCSKLTTVQGSDNGRTEGGWGKILGGIVPQSPEAQMYCCPTPPITPDQCSAGPAARSSYALSVHTIQQCDSYTYAYDDAKGLARCGAQTQFEVTLCPKPGDTQPPQPPQTSVSMKMIIPNNVDAFVNGVKVTNNQMVSITSGSVLSTDIQATSACTLSVDSNSKVSGLNGTLCSKLVFDNTNKSITFPAASGGTSALQLQFNMNTTVGISAYLNGVILVNATPVDSKNIPKSSILTAYQNNKQGSCDLTINSDSVQKGNGPLCERLNIVKEGSTKVHIYLPADIPDMGQSTPPKPEEQPKNVTFGMAADISAHFNNELVINNSKIVLTNVADSNSINLTATQSQNTASCMFSKKGTVLAIVPNSGTLCNAGLTLIPQANGDYYIGLPNPIPKSQSGALYELGIASGMSVTINGQTIQWNSPDKRVTLAQGTMEARIVGASKQVRICPFTQQGELLTWPASASCQGVVLHGKVIYFPAF